MYQSFLLLTILVVGLSAAPRKTPPPPPHVDVSSPSSIVLNTDAPDAQPTGESAVETTAEVVFATDSFGSKGKDQSVPPQGESSDRPIGFGKGHSRPPIVLSSDSTDGPAVNGVKDHSIPQGQSTDGPIVFGKGHSRPPLSLSSDSTDGPLVKDQSVPPHKLSSDGPFLFGKHHSRSPIVLSSDSTDGPSVNEIKVSPPPQGQSSDGPVGIVRMNLVNQLLNSNTLKDHSQPPHAIATGEPTAIGGGEPITAKFDASTGSY
uniref:Secreted protein n=1 Tax=Caenorhabditis tropicalis TaxID=1561998 RepID=A0A1I7TYM6_9PELO